MREVGDLDVPGRLSGILPRWATEALCAAACAMGAALVRSIIDVFVPEGAVFVLVYPTALLATLIAGWRSGVMALVLAELGVWYLIFPPVAFDPLSRAEATALIMNGLSCLAVIALAQAFRVRARAAHAERGAEIEERELLLRELNHRVKNNFQMVAGLLDMQRRRSSDPATEAALADALRRVHSMGQAHANLYPSSEGDLGAIDAAAYLAELCRNLADSLLLAGLVRLETDLQPVTMSHDRAVAIGLVTNELVTNAAKHAFPDGRAGVIGVTLRKTETGAQLIVADDGVGLSEAQPSDQGGLGRRLIEAFTRQAGGTLRQLEGPGARFCLELPR